MGGSAGTRSTSQVVIQPAIRCRLLSTLTSYMIRVPSGRRRCGSREKLPPPFALLTEAYTVASLIRIKSSGSFSVQFYDADKRRKTIYIGKTSDRNAEAICRHVEHLNTAIQNGQQPPKETLAWVAGVGPVLREKLAKAGLVEPDRRLTVGEFLAGWLDGKKGFRDHMRDQKYRATTVHKRMTHAKGMMEDAVRLGHIDKNPFKHVKTRQGDPSERRAYVRVEDVQRVIDHMPNVWWRLLVALARHAGLRVPSEPFALTWGDVDWERERLTVPSPKTEGQGKPHRTIPLFPLLKPHLEAAFDAAAEGDVYVFPHEFRRRAMGERGFNGANLRTTFGKCIRKAGVEPWPRMWHSLRASCESDLAQSFPLAVVAKWLGNTPSVALRHYVDPTDTAFDAAKTWQPGAAKSAAKALRRRCEIHCCRAVTQTVIHRPSRAKPLKNRTGGNRSHPPSVWCNSVQWRRRESDGQFVCWRKWLAGKYFAPTACKTDTTRKHKIRQRIRHVRLESDTWLEQFRSRESGDRRQVG